MVIDRTDRSECGERKLRWVGFLCVVVFVAQLVTLHCSISNTNEAFSALNATRTYFQIIAWQCQCISIHFLSRRRGEGDNFAFPFFLSKLHFLSVSNIL